MSTLLEQASLVMIPSGYKEDVVYSQIPTSGAGDLSFTRASNGTRINSAGLVEVCPWNIFQQSEDFSNAAWTKTNTTVTANSITAPNGTLTADLIVPANATDGVIVQASLSFIVGTSYSLSVYGKKEDFNFLLLALPSAAFPTSNRVALFDLNNGTIASSTQSGTGAVITDVGNGWYRCSITINATATTSANVVIAARSSNNLTSLGNGTDGIYIWGAQLNTGELKPYFPTTDRLNVPRLTYQNGGGGCPSLLLEKQSTNVFTYSEEFNDASWVKFNSSVSANTTTSPNGTQNADSLIENTSNTDHGFYKFAPTITTASGAVTISCFIKSNGRRVQIKNSYTTDASNFDLQNGVVVSNVGSGVGEIQNIGDGWYRCILKTTANASGNAGLTLSLLDNSNNMVYTGNGTSGVYIWGAQIEVSSYPTSYIPTTSSSATRVADACFKTGISSLIGQTEGVLFFDVDFKYIDQSSGVETLMTVNDGTTANEISILIDTPSGANKTLLGYVRNANVNEVVIYAPSPITATRYKIALAYKLNDVVLYVNGSLIGSDTSATIPTTSNLNYKSRSDGSFLNVQQEYVQESILFKTRLTNAELASLTTI